jgi:hypothetical protein
MEPSRSNTAVSGGDGSGDDTPREPPRPMQGVGACLPLLSGVGVTRRLELVLIAGAGDGAGAEAGDGDGA